VVVLSDDKAEWTFDTSTIPGYVAICYNSTSGYAINNNVENTTHARLFAHGSGNGSSFWAMETPTTNELEEGETGVLTYLFYFRGISVGKLEYRLPAGSTYPSYEEHIPSGYYVTSDNPLPTGTVHLKSELVEIPVERIPIDTEVEKIEVSQPAAQAAYYDLQGRRHAHPTKGLYIASGKKVVIK
jgi:hypothetical protein